MGLQNEFAQVESNFTLPGGCQFELSKPRRYSTTSTPPKNTQHLPMQLLNQCGQASLISKLQDVSVPPTVSILNMNLLNIPNCMPPPPPSAAQSVQKSGRSISVSDPLSMTELTSKSHSSHPRGRGGALAFHSTHGANKFKTEMCRPFNETGECKYGNKCQFAHGGDEMRRVPRHPKFKTEMCRTFHTTGFCPYGPRCHFIHNEDEYKLEEISHLKKQAERQQAAQQAAVEMAKIHLQKTALDAQLQNIIGQLAVANAMGIHQPTLPELAVSSVPPTPTFDTLPGWINGLAPNNRSHQLGSSGEYSPSGSGSTSPPVLSPTFSFDNDNDFLDFVPTSPSPYEMTSNHFVFPSPTSSPQISPAKEQKNTDYCAGNLEALANLLQGLKFPVNNSVYNMPSGMGAFS